MTHTTTYTEAECEAFVDQLAAAQKALHRLRLGQSAELVTHGDKTTRFTPAQRGDLMHYVDELLGKVDKCNGGCGRRPRGLQIIPTD